MDWLEHLKQTKNRLDHVSPSFCLAKWLQVTLHLQNGFNHSCHHPTLHKISLDEIAKDPSAIHNTAYKKEQRRMMLTGERPPECRFCWGVEDSPGEHFSDRIIKSADSWAGSRFEEVADSNYLDNINPAYVEVNFGYECNFRCSYCMPHISSSIWSQYEKHGSYIERASIQEIIDTGLRPYKMNEANPYIEAFWKWFPDLSKDLRVFRITGGEPLINSNTYRVLDYIDEHPLPELELCINSNLGISPDRYETFLKKIEKLTAEKKLKNFMMYTSADTHGMQAEYIRTGLNYGKWLDNVKTFLQRIPGRLTVMVTFNALSVPRFNDFLQDILELNRELTPTDSAAHFEKRITVDITHLMHPQNMAAWILNKAWREKIAEIEYFIESNLHTHVGAHGFTDYELHKIKRIKSWVDSFDLNSDVTRHFRGTFYVFTQQYEKREGRAFLDVFPEMREFYAECKIEGKDKPELFPDTKFSPI